MTLELVPLCTIVIDLTEPLIMANTPAGTRVIVEVQDFRVEGDRLRGKMKGSAAADWLTIGPDSTGTLDVRATMETDDGAVIYVAYQGRRDFSQGLDAPIYTAPKFDTGDERYAWLNKVQAAAKGTVEGTTLTYEVFELR
jgi:uncharacterized protein DUF3237